MNPAGTGGSCTARELAQQLGAELRGPGDRELSGIAPIASANADDLCFVRDPRHARAWPASAGGAVLVSRPVLDDRDACAALLPDTEPARAVLIVDDADLALIGLLERADAELPRERPGPGVHPSAVVAPDAEIGPRAALGPGVVIGPAARIGADAVLHAGVVVGRDARIGDGSELRANVVIGDRCAIGARCLLHPGVVIGADGFGYRPDPERGVPRKIPHVGRVEIGSAVEIGANTAIDRGKLGATTIGDHTKIDNLVQIAHNVRVGRSCLICGQCALAGSVTLGDGVTLAGGVGIADNIAIGAGSTVGARSGVMNDVPPGEEWVGYPARPARQYMRVVAAQMAMPDLLGPLKRLLRGQRDDGAGRS